MGGNNWNKITVDAVRRAITSAGWPLTLVVTELGAKGWQKEKDDLLVSLQKIVQLTPVMKGPRGLRIHLLQCEFV